MEQEKPEAPQRPSIVDWLGPGPTVTIILTVGSAVVVGALSLWALVGAHADNIAYLTKLSDDHEERIREQERRPPRLAPGLDRVVEEHTATAGRVAVMEERLKALESRIVGIGPEGWHRKDHDLYARMQDERNDRIKLRLDLIEQKQEQLCARVKNCDGGAKR